MNRHSLQVLEYADALALVAGHASSSLGARAVRALAPSTDPGWIEPELRSVEEMATLLTREGNWAMPAIPELRAPLDRLRLEGSVWEAPVLRDAGVLLASCAPCGGVPAARPPSRAAGRSGEGRGGDRPRHRPRGERA